MPPERGVRHVAAEREIPAAVGADRFAVEEHLCVLVDGAEVKLRESRNGSENKDATGKP